MPHNTLFHNRTRRSSGFTLVEILIVVVILGILAAIVIPKFSNASQVSREGTLKEDMRFLRTQISIYSAQHHDVNPGYPAGNTTSTPTSTDFVNQLTLFTDENSNTNATLTTTYKYGPYLSRMPENPIGGDPSIKIDTGTSALTADGTTGWVYQPATGAIEPNLTGNDSTGKAYASY